ncbi:MAG: nuclear transport factor 2 family protein [Allomuricauda sp.]
MYLILIFAMLLGCQQQVSSIEQWKEEIRNAENSFAQMTKEEGIHDAFLAFADEKAVLLRGDKLIIGKDSIDAYLENQVSKSLVWAPDFVDVSLSGDLGYTYGKYTFSYLDENGKERKNEGFFHTVWKRQPDGAWKFVWD